MIYLSVRIYDVEYEIGDDRFLNYLSINQGVFVYIISSRRRGVFGGELVFDMFNRCNFHCMLFQI